MELPPPGTWTLDPAHSSVGAVAQHLGISSVHGRFTEFGGHIEIAEDLEKSRVEAVITAASIDTGNGMRDGHLKSSDFLDVERFPEIRYSSTGLTPAGPDRWTVHGELSLHGVVAVDLKPQLPGGARTRGAAYGRPSARRPSCAATTSP